MSLLDPDYKGPEVAVTDIWQPQVIWFKYSKEEEKKFLDALVQEFNEHSVEWHRYFRQARIELEENRYRPFWLVNLKQLVYNLLPEQSKQLSDLRVDATAHARCLSMAGYNEVIDYNYFNIKAINNQGMVVLLRIYYKP